MSPIRIFIVDDNGLTWEVLRRILSSVPEFIVIGETGAQDALRQIESQRPDVLLLDSRMEGCLPLLSDLKRKTILPRTLLLVAELEEEWGVRALIAGARGLVPRNASIGELIKAIHSVYAGEVWARRCLFSHVLGRIENLSNSQREKELLLIERLSAREREVFRCAAEGLKNKEIARDLGMSLATVKAHLTRVFQKLNLRDRVQLVAHFHGPGVSPDCNG